MRALLLDRLVCPAWLALAFLALSAVYVSLRLPLAVGRGAERTNSCGRGARLMADLKGRSSWELCGQAGRSAVMQQEPGQPLWEARCDGRARAGGGVALRWKLSRKVATASRRAAPSVNPWHFHPTAPYPPSSRRALSPSCPLRPIHRWAKTNASLHLCPAFPFPLHAPPSCRALFPCCLCRPAHGWAASR